jgi:hypothetical protein
MGKEAPITLSEDASKSPMSGCRDRLFDGKAKICDRHHIALTGPWATIRPGFIKGDHVVGSEAQ